MLIGLYNRELRVALSVAIQIFILSRSLDIQSLRNNADLLVVDHLKKHGRGDYGSWHTVSQFGSYRKKYRIA